jgi:hypothetical protein
MTTSMARDIALGLWLLGSLALVACGSSSAAPDGGGTMNDAGGADTSASGGAGGKDDGGAGGSRPDGRPAARACPLPPAGDGGITEIPGPSEAEIATQAVCTNGWCRENPFPSDEIIGGVWGTSANAVWIAAYNEEILYWDGVRYHQIVAPQAHEFPNYVPVGAIWGSGPDDVWIAGYGGVKHYDGFGWGPTIGLDGNEQVFAVSGTGPDDVWFGRQRGVVVHRTSAGPDVATQLTRSDTLDDAVLGVWAASRDDVWAVGTRSTISHFDGTGWKPVVPDLPLVNTRLMDVWGSGPNDVWIVGEYGVVLHWDGAALRTEPTFTAVDLHAAWGAGTEVWIVGSNGAVFRRVDGAWCNVWTGPRLDFGWIWGSGARDVWIGSERRIFHWDGQRWTERSREAPAPVDFGSITGTPDGTRWLTSDRNVIRWDAAGMRVVPPPLTGPAHPFSADDIWTISAAPGGVSATVPAHWNGQSLTLETTGSNVWLDTIGGTSAGNLWVGGDGVLLGRTASGWQAPAGLALGGTRVRHLWFRTPADGWALGEGLMPILRWDGARWSAPAATGATAAGAVWGSATDDAWVLTDLAVLHWDGRDFAAVQAPLAGMFGITGTGLRQAWIFGGQGGLAAWDGTQWSPQASGTAKTLVAGWTSPGGDTYLVGREGIVLHRRPGAQP